LSASASPAGANARLSSLFNFLLKIRVHWVNHRPIEYPAGTVPTETLAIAAGRLVYVRARPLKTGRIVIAAATAVGRTVGEAAYSALALAPLFHNHGRISRRVVEHFGKSLLARLAYPSRDKASASAAAVAGVEHFQRLVNIGSAAACVHIRDMVAPGFE
jgi:hypothetical protein